MLSSILGISGKEYTRIVPALFAYLFNRITMEGFVSYVDNRDEGLRIKDLARVNGYVLKNCKLYAYACYCNRVNGTTLPKARDYGVTSKDATLLRRLNLKHLDHRKHRAFTLEEFDATVDTMVGSSEIRNYIGKFVTKKMSFIIKSYGETRDDIETYLKEMAIIAVYKQYPRYDSYEHFVNVAKAQIHNKGQSFITSMTSKSRQRLQQNSDGLFEAVHVPLESLATVEAPPVFGSEIHEGLSALAQIEHKLPERTREFLLCAAGQYHDGFSAYLKRGNDDAVETMDYSKYLTCLQKYFGITPERTERLFSNIRRHVYGVNHDRFRSSAEAN
jgi:hypothetical protein